VGAAPAGRLEAAVSHEPEGAGAGPEAVAADSLVEPLDRLPAGRAGRILSIVPREPGQLARLASFGIVPGTIVRLQQCRPAVVLRAGETTLALDPAIAAGIAVKRIEEDEP
jgi:Fe2+ transport system protein FeoA